MAARQARRPPRGIANNNPLNIRLSANGWIGKVHKSTDLQFEQFDTLEHGIRAGFIIFRTYINRHGLIYLPDFISRFAPASENQTTAYIQAVADIAQIGLNERLRFERRGQMARLAYAMIIVECGRNWVTYDKCFEVYGTFFGQGGGF